MSSAKRLDVDASLIAAMGGRALDLADLDSVRLILHGNSIIDWNRAHFSSLGSVDRFLALHLLDRADPEDRRRLRFVYSEAINYMQEHLGLSFPSDLREPEDVREVFLLASETGGFRRRQILACVILKLMHVINHMEAAELRFQTPLSEADVLDLAERRISAAADRMRDEGFPLVAFYGSRKTRNSVITKLIAKKENTAATIFDKLRFRIVTEQHDQILPAVAWLTRNLFPFNYVIPGQSHNNLVDVGAVLGTMSSPPIIGGNEAPALAVEADAFPNPEDALPNPEDAFPNPEDNPFSGPGYKMINFIVDFPVRVDHLVDIRYGAMLGRTVFALVEFQVLDQSTARSNEEGENAHDLYKERQRAIVDKRLKRGGRWKRQRS